MATDRVREIEFKIERAKKYIRDLDLLIQRFIDSQLYTIGTKSHPVKEIEHTVLYVAPVEPVPKEIPLVIGDAIHNLRSALDHLMWQLVEAAGGTPDENTAFPIFWTDALHKYQSRMGNGEIQKIVAGAKNLLSAAQPYNSRDDTLRQIHELDIWDKHRLLIVTAVGYQGWVVELAFRRDAVFAFKAVGTEFPVPLKANQEIVNLPTSTYKRQSHEDFKLTTAITFGQPQILEGEPFLETLDHLTKFTDGLLTSFEPFLI